MLVIGILAAMALPTFLGHREKAADSAAKSNVGTAQTAMHAWATETGAFNARPKDLITVEPSLKGAQNLKTGRGTTTFWVQTTSSSGNVFRITLSGRGVVKRDCGQKAVGKKRGMGGCRSSPDGRGNYW